MLERCEEGSFARRPLVAQVSSAARAKFLEMQSIAGPAATAADAQPAHPEIDISVSTSTQGIRVWSTSNDKQILNPMQCLQVSHECCPFRCVVETNLINEFGNRNLETSVGWLGASPDERDEYCLVTALFGTQLLYYISVSSISSQH